MLICKASVRFKRLTPALMEILNTLFAMDQHRAADVQPADLVITSANDSTHGATSRHYRDEAIDVRSKTFPEGLKGPFRALLEAELGPRFRVLLEDRGTPNEHFHCQVKKGQTFP
jgi:hypothetical protein